MRLAPLLAVSLAALAGAVGPVLADAVVYEGAIGDKPVVLELTAPPEDGDPVAGRYATMEEGIDIFLAFESDAPTTNGAFTLAEDAPCGPPAENLCTIAEDGSTIRPAPSADWTLTASGGTASGGTASGGTLTGTWKSRATGKTLPIALERRATRPIDLSEGMLVDALGQNPIEALSDSAAILDPTDFPYDLAKLDVPTTKGPATAADGAVVRMDPDVRLGLEYPVVETLGGPDIGPVNAFLRQKRFFFDLSVLTCWSGNAKGVALTAAEADEMKNGAEISATLERVSPELIGYREAGSPFCGGAHPDNFLLHRLVDAKTGVPVLAESLLAGWTFTDADGKAVDPATYDNGDYSMVSAPDAALIEMLKNRREKFDAERETGCGYDDIIDRALGVYLTQDTLVFTLQGLSHAEFGCGDDLLTIPLVEAKPLLTPAAVQYFPALAE